MVRFLKLFEIKFFHEFTQKFETQSIKVILSRETIEAIKSYQLILRETAEGLIVLVKEDKKFLLENLKEKLTLTIGLQVSNRYFSNFSDVELIIPNKKYYLTNDKDTKFGEILEKNSHPNSFLSKKNVCLCCVEDSNMAKLLGKEESTIERKGEVLFSGNIQSENAYNIFGADYGWYDVSSQDIEENQILYLESTLSKAFAIVDISIGENQLNEILDSTYQIRFKNRTAKWNYYFVHPERSFDTVEVYRGKEKLSFTDPEELTLQNGQRAIMVSSNEELPLYKDYKDLQIYAWLKEPSTDGSHSDDQKINLPTPDINKIKGGKLDGEDAFYSNMYVHL